MAYTKNPNLPQVRWQAVKMLRSGKSTRAVARYFGFNQSTVVRWQQKAELLRAGPIPTESSRPKRSPGALSKEKVQAIIKQRLKRNRCGQLVHQELLRKGLSVSLSSVQRTLERCGLLRKRSPWKRPHDYTERPGVLAPGSLMELDTIHLRDPWGGKIYVYTLIDVYSRFAYVEVAEKIGVEASIAFIGRAKRRASFPFHMVQTDHGSEFSIGFTHALKRRSILHRHSRVRQSNDQAHVERFNRTLQEECLDLVPHSLESYQKALRKYLPYYNQERIHMGLNYFTPSEVMQRC